MGCAGRRASRALELSPSPLNFKLSASRKMFGTLTLIKRNGSEGSTMTMDSRETTIGRYAARALACRAPRAAHRRAARSNT